MDHDADQHTWHEISVSREELKLENVLPTGQAFRWQKYETDDKITEWTGVISDKLYTMRQTDTEVLVLGHNPEPDHILDATISNYFQLSISSRELVHEWLKQDLDIDMDGVRILRQDPLETLLAFICSSNNNISRISKMMNQLCRHYGNLLGSYRGHEHHTLPTLESLSGEEETLRGLALGYRGKYIAQTSSHILDRCPEGWLESLKCLDYQEAWLKLQELPGVGPKVADCVCLMGLGMNCAVPVDVHMSRVASRIFRLKGVGKSLSLSAYREIGNLFRERYGQHAGWAQAALFRREMMKDKSRTP